MSPTADKRCEACGAPATAVLSYLSTTSRGGKRVYWPVCEQHGAELWQKLAQPLRETAIIEHIGREKQ